MASQEEFPYLEEPTAFEIEFFIPEGNSREPEVRGQKVSGFGSSSRQWSLICSDHVEEFPMITEMHAGTFNVKLDRNCPYRPPDDSKYIKMAKERGVALGRGYGAGNHISPRAKVIEINGHHIEAWIYRGHNSAHVLELITGINISESFRISDGDTIHLKIEHFPEGTSKMPGPPLASPGQTIH